MEARIHSRVRGLKILGTHVRKTLKGHAVKVLDKTKGNEILEDTKKEYTKRRKAELDLRVEKINDIHTKYNAPKATQFKAPPAPRKWSGKVKH